jgi:MFS transporter, DHA1 family, multidrug resistance protein
MTDSHHRIYMTSNPSSFPWKRNLIVLWFAQVVTTLGFSFTFPFFPIFFGEVGVSDPERAAFLAGVSGGMLGLGMGIFAPIWGVVGDRYGRKLNILRALVLGAVFLILSGYAQNGGQLVVSRFFVGATSGVVPTIMALVAAHTPREKLPMAGGATMSALLLGTAIGPLVGGVIFDNFGMRASFWATGLGLLFAAAMVLIMVREDFVKPEAVKSPLEPFKSLWSLVGNSRFLPVLVMAMMLHAGVLMITPAVAGLVATLDGGSSDASLTGVVFAAIGIAGAISSFGMGWLAGRIGIRRMFIVAAAVASVSSVGPFFADGFVEFTLLLAFVALFQGGLAGLLQGLIALRTPTGMHGSAFGASQVAHSLGTGLGPMIGGAAVVMFGFRSVFLVNVGLFAIVMLLAVFLIKTTAAAGAATPAAAEPEEA